MSGLLGGGGGGGSANQTVTTQNTVSKQAAPYVENMLGKTEALANTPYVKYEGNRVADFTDLQNKASTAAGNLGIEGATTDAAALAKDYAGKAAATKYDNTTYGNQFTAPEGYQSSTFAADKVSAPGLQNYQMTGPQDVAAQNNVASQMSAAQTGYNPQLQNYQMGQAQQVGSQNFSGQSAQDYMSPYMQNVVDAQQREAQRAADIAGTSRGAQAAKMGAYGGSRSALLEAEANRNLATQKGDIQNAGLQSAYQNAMSQFNADQGRNLQAQMANQQAGLTTGSQNLAANLGVQQLGTQTGLQTSLANMNAQQQANVQNQAAQLQAMGLNSSQALQAALANQQTGYNVGAQNLAANLGIQQLGSGQNMQAQLANQAGNLQAATMGEQSKQYGYGQGMTAANLNAQYGLGANQLSEQSKQYGAGLGLQGLQAGMSGASALGNIGQNQYGQRTGNINIQNQLGGQAQGLQQQKLDVDYQNYMAQKQDPYNKLAFQQSMLSGLPISASTQNVYAAAPSMSSQIAGMGTTALAGAKLAGYARGGKVGSGIDDLGIYNAYYR